MVAVEMVPAQTAESGSADLDVHAEGSSESDVVALERCIFHHLLYAIIKSDSP